MSLDALEKHRPRNLIIATSLIHFVIAGLLFKILLSIDSAWFFNPILYSFLSSSKEIHFKAIISHLVGLVPLTAVLIAIGRNKYELHGSARFAYGWEFIKRYKKNVQGIFLGYLGKLKLIVDGDYHILIKAPTRAGKGVSWVVPIFFTWLGSIISIDIKEENFYKTAGFRKRMGQDIHFLNFIAEDKHSDCFNVFDYMPEDNANRISFLQKVSNFLAPTPPGGDPIWTGGARKLFEGLALMAKDIPALTCSFGQIFRMLHTEQKTNEYLKDMIEEHEDILDPICKMNLYSFINLPEKTRGGVQEQLASTLNIFANPIIDAATSNSSFDLRDIKYKKMSIYVAIPPASLVELGPMVNLFFQMAIDLNLKVPKDRDPKYKHNCLFMMDEFTSVGYMETVARKIEFIAGYGIQLMLVAQGTAQLYAVYKQFAEHIEDNCDIKGYLTPNNTKTANKLSEDLGTITIEQKSTNRAWSGIFPKHENISETKRPLMLPQEIKEMPPDKCLIFLKGLKAIYADRIFWYTDPRLKNNEFPPPKIPLLEVKQTLEIKAKMKTIEVDINDLEMPIYNKVRVLSDDESIACAEQYLNAIGEMA